MSELLFAFLDVETTGLSTVFNDRICEVAILRCQGAEDIDSWQSLVNPCRQLSPAAAAVNGITDAMVAGAPKFAEVADAILEKLDGAVLVCHNASFDLGFLTYEMAACNKKLPNLQVIDTLKVARRHFTFPSNSLGNIATRIGIDPTGAHRALADVITTRQIFDYMIAELFRRGMKSIDELLIPAASLIKNSGAVEQRLPPALMEALRLKKDMRLRYVSRNGGSSERVVTPLRVVESPEALFVEAYCSLRQERRLFRLDRIISMDIIYG